jgi:hypothetical protein
MNPHTPKWVPTLGGGFSNLQRAIAGAKTYCIKKFILSLESSWNLDGPFGYLKHKLWPKERPRVNSNCQFDFWPLKIKNCLDFLACMWHVTYYQQAFDEGYNFYLDLFLIKGLHTKLCTSKFTGVPISRISGLPFGSLGTKWQLGFGPMVNTENTIKGKVVASFKFRPWWVLWVCVYPWVVCAPKVLQFCTYQLDVWFVWIINLLVICLSPHLGVPTRPSTPKMLRVRECAPTLFPFVVFTFGLTIESIKEFGGVSNGIRALVKLDPPIGEFQILNAFYQIY